MCASGAKAAWLAAHQADLQQAQQTGQQIDMGVMDVELAVTTGLVMLPIPPPGQGAGPALVPLCWSHVTPIQFIESALMPASMIPTGPGGAVDLSARRG